MPDSLQFGYSPGAPALSNTLDLEAVQHQIAVRKGAMIRLRTELRKLEEECKAYQALLPSPWQSAMPLEVLGDIFAIVLSKAVFQGCEDWQVTALCLVCARWRQAALATQELWTNLELRGGSEDPGSTVRKVRTWFARSGTLPKRLTVFDTDHGDSHSEDDGSDDDSGDSSSAGSDGGGDCFFKHAAVARLLLEGPVLDELHLRCGSSIQCFQELVHTVEAMKLAHPQHTAAWNSLRSLRLNLGEGWWDEAFPNPPVRIFDHLPSSITTLSLKFPSYWETDHRHPLGSIELPQLTTLELEAPDWPLRWIFLTLFGCSLTMQHLTLDLGEGEANWSEGPDLPLNAGDVVYDLRKVQTLRLKHLPSRNRDIRLLRYVKMPLLTELDISFENEVDEEDDIIRDPDAERVGENVVHFLKESQCIQNLRQLRIHSLRISRQGMERILRPLRDLRDLTLDTTTVKAQLFRPGPQEDILPGLRTLKLVNMATSFDYIHLTSYFKIRLERLVARDPREKATAATVTVAPTEDTSKGLPYHGMNITVSLTPPNTQGHIARGV